MTAPHARLARIDAALAAVRARYAALAVERAALAVERAALVAEHPDVDPPAATARAQAEAGMGAVRRIVREADQRDDRAEREGLRRIAERGLPAQPFATGGPLDGPHVAAALDAYAALPSPAEGLRALGFDAPSHWRDGRLTGEGVAAILERVGLRGTR